MRNGNDCLAIVNPKRPLFFAGWCYQWEAPASPPMDPSTFAALLAEYGTPSEIAASLASDGPGALDDVLLSVRDLRRFELPEEAAEAVAVITGHLVTAQRLLAALPEQLRP